jgi:hypothetical protein
MLFNDILIKHLHIYNAVNVIITNSVTLNCVHIITRVCRSSTILNVLRCENISCINIMLITWY